MLMANNTEEFRHTYMLMICKVTSKNIFKAFNGINFVVSGAVLSVFNEFLYLIFKSSALKSYDYLYHFYVILLLSISSYHNYISVIYIISIKFINKIPLDYKLLHFSTKG